MIRDFWKQLLLREVVQTSDGGGGFTEATYDSAIYGYIGDLSGSELERNQTLGNNATSALFTEADLKITDRVVDGTVEWEIVWKFENFHTYYPLKRVK
jgi:hypothetical protein